MNQDFLSFERILAYHCAPTLDGIKASNLVALSKEKFQDLFFVIHHYESLFMPKGIGFKILCECHEKVMLLVYQKNLLQNILCETDVQNFLHPLGYPEIFNEQIYLAKLSQNFRLQKFPHEIGLFLGYPLCDVKGFMKNQGRDFKFCGYWKVYGDVEKCKKLFFAYGHARKNMLYKLSCGATLSDFLSVS